MVTHRDEKNNCFKRNKQPLELSKKHSVIFHLYCYNIAITQ